MPKTNMTKEEWLEYLPLDYREYYDEYGYLHEDQLAELHKLNHEWLVVNYYEITCKKV